MLKVTRYKDVVIGQGKRSLLNWSLSVCLFVVDGLLIDTGPESLKGPSSAFFKGNRIEQAVITHMHEDHSGMACWLQKHLHIPVYLHEKAIPEARRKPKYPLYRRLVWGKRPAFEPQPMPAQIETGRHVFEAIESPGHCAYHYVFYERNEGWLFTGDLYVGVKQLVAFKDENLKETISTIQGLLKLEFGTVFCAHSGVVQNGKAMLQKKLEFMLGLQDKVNALRKEGLNDREIDKKLYPRKIPMEIVSRGEWSTYNLVSTI